MRALVASQRPPHVELADVEDPSPAPDQALVATRAFSLNRGEARRLEALEPGTVPGWDVAGMVAEPAADGSGPPAGARVVGVVRAGAWAQQVAVPTDRLAELPDGVSFEQASTLPVAGLTALRALEVIGFVAGKQLLVTGASGGVGRFVLQLAKLGGAHVTALARRQSGLRELGADELIEALEPDGPRSFEGVIDAVGGPVLGAALQRIAPGATVVSFASTVTDPVSFPTRAFFAEAPRARLQGLFIFDELDHTRSGTRDLRRLADLIAAGRLDPQIDTVASWCDAGPAIEALLDRRVAGKAVLRVED